MEGNLALQPIGATQPCARLIAGDVLAERLPSLRVGVHFLIGRRRLWRERAQVAAVAERAIGEVVAMKRDLARLPKRAQRRIGAERKRAAGQCHDERQEPGPQEEFSLTSDNLHRYRRVEMGGLLIAFRD